jgi:hypothetical protein
MTQSFKCGVVFLGDVFFGHADSLA